MGVGTPDDILEVGGARHRHVRLRDADPRRPPRPRLHPARQGQPAQRPPCRRPAAARRGKRLPGGARLFAAPICTISCRSSESLGAMLLTWNNLAYYQDLMQRHPRRASRRAGFEDARGRDLRRLGAGRSAGALDSTVGSRAYSAWRSRQAGAQPSVTIAPTMAGRASIGLKARPHSATRPPSMAAPERMR